MKTLNTLAIAAAFASTTCVADWQYAKFGMTAEEVIAASNGEAIARPEGSPDKSPTLVLATSTYSLDDLRFKVYFHFDRSARLLQHVVLNLEKATACRKVVDQLRVKYGEPLVSDKIGNMSAIYNWRSEASGNQLSLQVMHIGDLMSCSLQYSPLSKAGKGL